MDSKTCASLRVDADEVHLWSADLNVSAEAIAQFQQSLSLDEKVRAARFVFERHRHYFIAGRGILRSILSRYLGLDPNDIRFAYGERGKPMLIQPLDEVILTFNLSHSNGMALYAIAVSRRVGIDLEYTRKIEALQLAKHFFTPREYADLCALPLEQQHIAFFQAWTCKEAYLKATGDGLVNLEQVEVAIAPSPVQILRMEGEWLLQTLQVNSDYAAALAVEGTSANMIYHQWIS